MHDRNIIEQNIGESSFDNFQDLKRILQYYLNLVIFLKVSVVRWL